MKKTLTLYILLTTFLSSCEQTNSISITDTKKINIEEITDKFDIQNYFDDKDLSKKGEYLLKRESKILILKEETKDNVNYDLTLHSSTDTLATFGSLGFDVVEGFTDKENIFFGLVFKSTKELKDNEFQEKIDYLQQKLGKPNYQFRDPMWDAVSKKLYS